MFGQSEKFVPHYSCAYLGYTWQGTHNIEYGANFLLKIKPNENRDNIGLILAANLNYLNNSFYLTPLPKIHYRKSFKKNKDLCFHLYKLFLYKLQFKLRQ